MTAPKNVSDKDLTGGSFESQMGECDTLWLLTPPFDPRDYMISPSESASASLKNSEREKEKKRLRPSEIKIDAKYLLDSHRALKKLSELTKGGSAPKYVGRLKELVHRFLQGSPPGFFVEDLPLVIEVVEYFSRNRSSAPEFTDFVKSIMCCANDPPKMEKSSDALHYKDTMIDYFTLFGELLATFEEESFQSTLFKVLESLTTRRKLVDVNCVKFSTCIEAMERSQLPYAVVALMETVSSSLYLSYLELALQMLLISLKAGHIMIKSNVLDFVLLRFKPFSIEEKCEEPVDEESKLQDHYKLIDKSSYLLWGFLAIISKRSVEVPVPGAKALRSLRDVFEQETRKDTSKARDVRNNLAGIIVKLCAVFGEKLPVVQAGLAVDIAALSVAGEVKAKGNWSSQVRLGTNREDYVFRKLMLLGCCVLPRDKNINKILKCQKVIEGVLRRINPRVTGPWSPSQFIVLYLTALRTLSELAPQLPEEFVKAKGNAMLLSAIEWLMENPFDERALLETLKTFCTVVTCENNKSIIEDIKAQNGVRVMLDLCLSLLDVEVMKMDHQEKLTRVFIVLERVLMNEENLLTTFGESCAIVSAKFLERIVADLKRDSKWGPKVLLAFGGFLWEAVAWCPPSLQSFVGQGGVLLLLDFIESRCFPLQMFFLGILVDMTDLGETIAHLVTWRGRNGYGILNLLIDIWRKEECLNKVHRTKEGFIRDLDAPLMTEEQWFLIHQVRGSHLYSPACAEMMGSARPKVHALYQFLHQRYFSLAKVGEETYCLQMNRVQPCLQVYIPLIEHFLAMKLGEIWSEVMRDANYSGLMPTAFDGHVICTLLDERHKWATRIRNIQEEIYLSLKGGEGSEEQKFYHFLKSCELSPALEAMNELDYVARSSFQKFQKQKKKKQIEEVDRSLSALTLISDDDTFHRTYIRNTNTTFMTANYVWVKSERDPVMENADDLQPVSPDSFEGRHPFDDGFTGTQRLSRCTDRSTCWNGN